MKQAPEVEAVAVSRCRRDPMHLRPIANRQQPSNFSLPQWAVAVAVGRPCDPV